MDQIQKALDEYEKLYEKTLHAKRAYLKKALTEEVSYVLAHLDHRGISDEEYNDVILPFWAKYNVVPEKFWFSFYGSKRSEVNPLFIPADIYFCGILPYLNDLTFKFATQDKGALPERLPGIKQAKTIARRMSGLYYDDKMNMISKESAVDLCMSHDNRIVLKPSLYTKMSKGISVVDPALIKREELEKIFEDLGTNFIVQDRIVQHPELARLNPSTVNTIRINSFLSDKGVYIAASIIRVGSPGQEIIEKGQDEWACGINDDNTIEDRIINLSPLEHGEDPAENVRWEERPFDKIPRTYTIPSMDRVREAVKKVHPLLPHFKWIGWDLTVDTEGDPVLMEINLTSGHTWQFISGRPMFGDMTGSVLDDYYIHRAHENDHRQDRLFE